MNFNPFAPKAQIERNSWFVAQRDMGKSFNAISFDHLEKTGIRVSPQRIKQIIDRELKRK